METAEPRGGAGSRKFATGTAPPRLEQPLVGKPGAGALAAKSRSASPPRGSPPLLLGGGERQQTSKRAPRPLRLLPPRAGDRLTASGRCFPFTARPPQRRRATAAASAWVGRQRNHRRLQGGRPAGKLEGRRRLAAPQDRLSQQFAGIVRQNPEVSPLAVHIRKEDAAQPGAWAGNPHPPSERKEARKVSKRAWEFLTETAPSGSSRRGEKRGAEGGGWGALTLIGLALANFKPPGSQMAGRTRGRLPRAASTDRSPRAGQAPPGSVHASRICGTWRSDAGRALWAPGVRSPKCSGWVEAAVWARTGCRGPASRRQGDSK